MKIYIVIPIFNNIEFTSRALASFKKNTSLKYNVVLVDNCSTDGSEILSDIKGVHYIKNEQNEGFVKAVNKGIQYSLDNGADYVIIANNDIIVSNNWLEKMLESMKDGVGVTGLMTSDGGKDQSIFILIDRAGITPQKTDEINKYLEDKYSGVEIEEKNSIIFCLAMIKREVFEKIGLLSEEFGVGFGDDGDFNIRAKKAGYKLIIRKDGFFYHYRRTTFSQLYSSDKILDMQKNNIEILKQKHPEHFNGKERLRILLTNNHLIAFGGSETFTYTMAKELVSRGHEVEVYTLNKGAVSKRISEFAKIVDKPQGAYDLILVNHNSCLRNIRGVKGYKIFTSHGIYPALEQAESGADAYVSISPEVKQHLKNKGYNSTLIYNGIDCDRFNIKKPINKELKNVFTLCQGKEARDKVRQACEILGLNFIEITSGSREWNIEDYINQADVIVTLGRGAYEAMACGRNVLVYDSRPYGIQDVGDGMIDSDNMQEILKCNMSGRSLRKTFDVAGLVAEFKKYNYEQGEKNHQFALENFNIKNQVNKYLGMYITR